MESDSSGANGMYPNGQAISNKAERETTLILTIELNALWIFFNSVNSRYSCDNKQDLILRY